VSKIAVGSYRNCRRSKGFGASKSDENAVCWANTRGGLKIYLAATSRVEPGRIGARALETRGAAVVGPR
jgi:hypothetical protein